MQKWVGSREREREILMLLSNPATWDARPLKEANSLARNGYHVTIFAWDREGGSPKKSFSANLEIKRFRLKAPYGQNLITLLGFALFYVWCFFNSFAMQFQTIHCHDVDTLPLGIILKVSRRRVGLVYDIHDHPIVFLNRFPKSGILTNLVFFFARRYADRVVVVNDGFVKLLVATGFEKEKLAVVMNVPETAVEEPRLHENGIFRIFYYGDLGRERGVHNLVQAVKSLSGVFLILAGKGDLVPWITKSKENWANVTYLGWISMSEIDRVRQTAHLIPTLYLPININNVLATPAKFFTSISNGLPAVVPEGTYMAALVRKYKCGLIINAENVKSIRNLLRNLVKDKSLYDRMARNGIKIARETFNWKVMEKRLLSMYSTLEAHV